MNAITVIPADSVPAIGAAFEGGFFAGRICVEANIFGIVAAPKAAELVDMKWGKYGLNVDARSYFDGYANTVAMAEAGSELARLILALNIDGRADYYLPSRDELELLYRAFKPTAEKNYEWRHGDNPSSVPAGYPYTGDSPAKTGLELFRDGGVEAFADTWYWSSTQSSSYYAWFQGFGVGSQSNNGKDVSLRARAVRRLFI